MFSVFPEVSFPGGATIKAPACQCRRYKRCVFNPWVRKIPWRREGNPLQYSWLENPMDRGASQAIYNPWVAQSQTRLKRLSTHSHLPRGRALLYLAECQAWVSRVSKKNVLSKYLHLLKLPVSGVAVVDTTEKQEALGQAISWEKHLGKHPTWKELPLHPICTNKAF